jgi:hypothetical protein
MTTHSARIGALSLFEQSLKFREHFEIFGSPSCALELDEPLQRDEPARDVEDRQFLGETHEFFVGTPPVTFRAGPFSRFSQLCRKSSKVLEFAKTLVHSKPQILAKQRAVHILLLGFDNRIDVVGRREPFVDRFVIGVAHLEFEVCVLC